VVRQIDPPQATAQSCRAIIQTPNHAGSVDRSSPGPRKARSQLHRDRAGEAVTHRGRGLGGRGPPASSAGLKLSRLRRSRAGFFRRWMIDGLWSVLRGSLLLCALLQCAASEHQGQVRCWVGPGVVPRVVEGRGYQYA
jgi:hypothetical protein